MDADAGGGAGSGSVRVNPWLRRRVLLAAHRGGSLEAPENTMAAFRRAVGLGAEMLELDVRATRDGHLVVMHDETVDRTTGGTGAVVDLRLPAIRELDAAYWFVPGTGPDPTRAVDDYPLRGVATGDRAAPDDTPWAAPDDLRVPTLEEVLEAFPDTLLTIEVKATAPDAEPYEEELARLLAAAGRGDDVIVGSFHEVALDAVAARAPEVSTSAPPSVTGAFWEAATEGREPPGTTHAALQVPLRWEGVEVVSERLVEVAHGEGLAVHVWTVDDAETMRWLVDVGVDAILSDRPTLLRDVLDELGARFEGG